MKKFQKVLSLLMVGAMLALPTAMSAQAAEAIDDTNGNSGVMPMNDPVYSTYAMVLDSTQLRETPSSSGAVVYELNPGFMVQVDKDSAVEIDGVKWYPCKYVSVYGYVRADALRLLG